MNSAIERLKEEAAKVGANGVLLTKINERQNPDIASSYGSATVTGSRGWASITGNSTTVIQHDRYTRLQGLAIYVQQPK